MKHSTNPTKLAVKNARPYNSIGLQPTKKNTTTTNKRMNNKIKRKPLQQLINNTPKKTIKVITSKNIPISNNTTSTTNKINDNNNKFQIFKQNNLSIKYDNNNDDTSNNNKNNTMYDLLTSILTIIKKMDINDFNIQLYNHTKKKKKKLPSSLKTTTINSITKELLINTIEKRCRRVLGKKKKTKNTATTPSATPQQMLTSEYIIQEIILAILLETKELTFNVTKSTTTTTTSSSNTINNLLIQASNDRILILQNLKSKYNFKDWAYVNILKNIISSKYFLSMNMPTKNNNNKNNNPTTPSTYNTHKLLKKIKALELRNENREKYALIQVQKLLEDNKQLNTMEMQNKTQLSNITNELTDEKLKCRKLEVRLAESNMAYNQTKHQYTNLKQEYHSNISKNEILQTQLNKQQLLIGKLKNALNKLENNFNMSQKFNNENKLNNQLNDVKLNERVYLLQTKAQKNTLNNLTNEFNKLKENFMEEQKNNIELNETYEELQNEFDLYKNNMEAEMMQLSEKTYRISNDKITYENTLEQLEHKYVDSVDIIKTTSNECLSLTNEMNELKGKLRETTREKKILQALNTSYMKQIRSLEEMKNKTIADKHLIENMMNKEISTIKNSKKEIMEHFQTVEKELKFELKTKSLQVNKLQDELDISNQYLVKYLHNNDDMGNVNTNDYDGKLSNTTRRQQQQQQQQQEKYDSKLIMEENDKLHQEILNIKSKMNDQTNYAQKQIDLLYQENQTLKENIVNLASANNSNNDNDSNNKIATADESCDQCDTYIQVIESMKKIDNTYATIEQATISTSDMFTQTILLSNTIDQSTETDEDHIVNKHGSTNAYNEMKKLFDSCEIELRQVQTDLQECMKEKDELKGKLKVALVVAQTNNIGTNTIQKVVEERQVANASTNTMTITKVAAPVVVEVTKTSHSNNNNNNQSKLIGIQEEMNRLQKKLKKVHSVIQEKDFTITDLSAENISLQNELEAIKSKWFDDLAESHNNNNNNTTTTTMNSTTTTNDDDSKQITETISILQTNVKNITFKYDSVLKKLQSATYKVDELTSTNDKLTQDINVITSKYDNIFNVLDTKTIELNNTISSLENDVNVVNNTLQTKLTTIASLNNQLGLEKQSIETLKQQLTKQEQEFDDTTFELNQALEVINNRLKEENEVVMTLKEQLAEEKERNKNDNAVANDNNATKANDDKNNNATIQIQQQQYDELKMELESTVTMYNKSIETLNKQLQTKTKNCNDLKEMVHKSITNVKADLAQKANAIHKLTNKITKRDEKIHELQTNLEQKDMMYNDLLARNVNDQENRKEEMNALTTNSKLIEQKMLDKLKISYNEQLEQKVMKCNDLESKLKEINIEYFKSYNTLNTKFMESSKLCTDLEEQNSNSIQTMEVLKIEYAEQNEKYHKLETLCKTLEEQNSNSLQTMEVLKTEYAEQNEKYYKLETLCKTLEEQNSKSIETMEALKTEYTNLHDKYETLETTNNGLQQQNAKSIETMEGMKMKYNEQNQQVVDLDEKYQNAIAQVKTMENDNVLMEEALKEMANKGNNNAAVQMEKMKMLMEDLNNHRNMLNTCKNGYEAKMKDMALKHKKALKESIVENDKIHHEKFNNMTNRHGMKIEAYVLEVATYKENIEKKDMEIHNLQDQIDECKNEQDEGCLMYMEDVAENSSSTVQKLVLSTNSYTQTVKMQQQDEEIQTPIIDTSDSNSQTNKMEHNDQMSQVDTNALEDTNSTSDDDDDEYLKTLEKQIVDEKKSTLYFRTAMQSQKDLIELKETKIQELIEKRDEMVNQHTSDTYEFESEIRRLKKELSYSKQNIQKIKDEYRLTESLLQKTQEELATKTDQYDYQLLQLKNRTNTSSNNNNNNNKDEDVDEELSNISIGFIGSNQLVRAQTPPHPINIYNRHGLLPGDRDDDYYDDDENDSSNNTNNNNATTTTTTNNNSIEREKTKRKNKKRRKSEPMNMFGSPKSKSTPPKTSLDDSMDSSTSSSHDDSYANLTPYGAYTPLAVKIQRYAAELSGKLKNELDITMDDTTFGESNGSSNSLGSSNISVKSNDSLMKNIDEVIENSLGSSSCSSNASSSSVMDSSKKINFDGTPMITLDISSINSTSGGRKSKHDGSIRLSSSNNDKKQDKNTTRMMENIKQPRSLNVALDVVAENDEFRQKMETENTRLKFYNSVLVKGIKRMSLGEIDGGGGDDGM